MEYARVIGARRALALGKARDVTFADQGLQGAAGRGGVMSPRPMDTAGLSHLPSGVCPENPHPVAGRSGDVEFAFSVILPRLFTGPWKTKCYQKVRGEGMNAEAGRPENRSHPTSTNKVHFP